MRGTSRPLDGQPQRFGSVHLIPIRPGLYSFTLLATIGRAPGAATTGTLDLWGAPSSRRHPPNRRITFVYNGAADLDLHRVGSPSVAYPVSSRDPGSPGVELSYDGDTHAVSLDLGNGFSPDTMRLDVGTILWVLRADSVSFTGRWKDGGRTPEPAGGYFCAWWQSPPPVRPGGA